MTLAKYLEKHRISQAEFAAHMNPKVSPGMIWQWLNKRRPIAAEKVIAIETATDGEVSRHDLRPDIYPRDQSAA